MNLLRSPTTRRTVGYFCTNGTRWTCRSGSNLRASFWNNARQASGSRTLRTGASIVAFAGIAALSVGTASTVFLDAVTETEPVRIDPDTNISFPETLVIPSKARFPPFTLLGVGVRTVSFIGLKVYSVGFYADLSNPNLKIPKELTPEEQVRYIIANTACAIRIIPTRSTSYTHLRDSYVRTLQTRLTTALKSGAITAEIAEEVQSPLRKLKSLFPNAPFAKHTPLDIILTAPPKNPSDKRAVIVRDLGVVENDWISNELFLAYFQGDGISPPMKKSVLETLSTKALRQQ